jgi:hypothetical protein
MAIAVIAFGIFTDVEYGYEPEAWNQDSSLYSFINSNIYE